MVQITLSNLKTMFDIAIKYLRDNWHKRSSLIVLSFLILLVLLYVFYSIDIVYIITDADKIIEKKITVIELAISGIITIIGGPVWYFSTRIPVNVRGRVGIIVAIMTENKDEKIKLKNDFIKTFHEKINKGNKQEIFNIIEYPEYYSSRITERNYTDFLRKSNSNFIIWGSLKKRMHEEKEHYFFKLDAAIIYQPLFIDRAKKLSKEMAELFPRQVGFGKRDEFKGFELLSDWSVFFTEYIIGVAAFLTADFEFSSNVHFKLYQQLNILRTNLLAIKLLEQRNTIQLIESLMKKHTNRYYEYYNNKDKELLRSINDDLKFIKGIAPHHYAANLLRAAIIFLLERNTSVALKELRGMKNKTDNTWLYSEAFLYAYDGNMKKAIQLYKKAFKTNPLQHVPVETEVFMLNVLDEEPGKCQLWFCLGLINLRAKNDIILAKEYLTKFLESSCSREYPIAKVLAGNSLKRI